MYSNLSQLDAYNSTEPSQTIPVGNMQTPAQQLASKEKKNMLKYR